MPLHGNRRGSCFTAPTQAWLLDACTSALKQHVPTNVFGVLPMSSCVAAPRSCASGRRRALGTACKPPIPKHRCSTVAPSCHVFRTTAGLLIKFGVPLTFLLAIEFVFLQNGGTLSRDLDVVELFAGKGNLAAECQVPQHARLRILGVFLRVCL